jgi:hypothetical protein
MILYYCSYKKKRARGFIYQDEEVFSGVSAAVKSELWTWVELRIFRGVEGTV